MREDAGQISETLDLDRIAARIEEEHRAQLAGLDACAAGTDENAVAAAMLAAATAAGSEAVAMEPLVASGPRSGLPHMTWRRRRLEPGDAVFLELAGSHARYHAALMRSVWIGPPPEEASRMMDCALRALDAALAAIRPGHPCAAPHAAAQAVIDAAGYGPAFRKRIGYSMGVAFAPDWGEGGLLSLFTGEDRPIEPGMVLHITTRQFARLVDEWVAGIGPGSEACATHALRRTKASLIHEWAGDLRAVLIRVGHTKIEGTARYPGVDAEDAHTLAEGAET